jgi:NADP-dependent 3-hydroxy acid dehydrogenase YdfG
MRVLLDDKTVVIYGAGAWIGGAVARAFAREGARVFPGPRYACSIATSWPRVAVRYSNARSLMKTPWTES